MIVTRHTFFDIVDKLSTPGVRSFDTETTGLNAYQEDSLFALIIADSSTEYYFNFHSYPNLPEEQLLPREFLSYLKPIFGNPQSYWYAHNAKFDLAILWREGIEVAGEVHCTLAIARIEYNGHLTYGLDACAERIGLKKDEAVEEYIKKEKKWEWEVIPGKKTRTKKKYFTKVPFEIIQPYGERDARVTFQLGEHQQLALNQIARSTALGNPEITKVFKNELRLTKTCFNMERTGILIDRKYCEEAIAFEEKNRQEAEKEFRQITGYGLTNSGKALGEIFSRMGESFPKTEKGNPSFTDDVLETLSSPAGLAVRKYRKAEKRLNTYFKNFLYFSDKQGVVHAVIKQGGTETGRFSYADPNLQNIPKRGEDAKEFPVRRAFIPRPGYFFAMLDYDQMEYKMMADYARETVLIEKILGGLDVHTACMEMMEMKEREPAKTINFMLLYGGGIAKLALSLFNPTVSEETLKAIGKIRVYGMKNYPDFDKHVDIVKGLAPDILEYNEAELYKAKKLFDLYFSKLPNVKEFISEVQMTAKNRGYIFNWLGRRCYFKNPRYCYAAPNHLIQGGGADVVKVAMNTIDAFSKGRKSKLLVQVHDELLFEIHESEVDILPELKHIMETTYPYRRLPLTCGIEHSFKSWGDKIEGMPEVADKFVRLAT